MKSFIAVALLLLLAVGVSGQQSVILSGSVPYSGTVPYSQTITLIGLPSGCVASLVGTELTFTSCPQSLPVGVSVTCNPTSVAPGGTVNCSAAVTNAANLGVVWSSSAGTISTVGVLTTPTTPGTVTVTATSLQDQTKSGSVAITVVTPATPVTVQAESAVKSSGPIVIQPTQDAGGGTKVYASIVGQTFDYTVNVPTAGVYILAVRICNLPAASGTTTVHFEYPAGPQGDVSGPLNLLNNTQWTTVVAAAGKTASLPAGSQTIRMVVDALASGATQINWFSLTPAGAPPSVKLAWNPSTSANLVGYNVYRRQTLNDPYVIVNFNPILAPPFVDTGVKRGNSYLYVVTTLGDPAIYNPPESIQSNEVQVTIQ